MSDPARRRWPARRVLLLVVLPWTLAVSIGFFVLLHYSVTPGAKADAPPAWPQRTALPLAASYTLVMVAHPRCSCTRASIAELSRLMTRLGSRAEAHVLFVRPAGFGDDWQETDLWRSASIIDGVRVWLDDEGREAARFGARTSGQVYLYDARGRLRFSGGITPSRSHQGDSVGRKRVIDIVTGGHGARVGSAVYGCGVEDDGTDQGLFGLEAFFNG